jgi:rRNA maturation protein Rpf1
VFPNSHRLNRGNYVVRELAEACRSNGVTDLVVVHEHRGVPGTPCSSDRLGGWLTTGQTR